ncbi:hypothetical protein KQI86_09390 [Clostridium sp. MSJ-11]|uniref:ABC transporter permease n=1 Tax=Clostridium mobile TaxID=2841512 RepID=A0ABS6EHP4_9CLOT|nr:hypothetical protein [Clostridium mobile]MBU5484543.1 hypothetical protein [Clostridium mobile]
MKALLRTFINSFKVSFAENANIFIYFLKRIPVIGKRIPEKLYKQTRAKIVFGIIKEILGIVSNFFRKSFYLGVMILLPSYLLINKDMSLILPEFLHIFFFLSFILGSIMNVIVFDANNRSSYNMITLMRVDAKEYYLGQIIYRNVEKFIYFMVPMIIIGSIIGLSPLKAVILITELTAFRFIGEWLHLFIYECTGKVIVNKNSFVFTSIIIFLILAYALPFAGFTIDFYPILFNNSVVLVLMILGILSFIHIWKYKQYTNIAKKLLARDNIFDIENFKSELSFVDVKLDEKNMTEDDLNSKIYDKKQGYEYLNSIFFKRHRKIILSPIKFRVLVITAMFLIGIVLILINPEKKIIFINRIENAAPLLVFIMYTMSTGERICKAMFYNCDVSLLRYSYYREGKVILSNFTSRLKKVVFLNIIPAFTLCLALIAFIIISGYSNKLISMIPLFLCAIFLSCFFSIHYLFMYYVIQPYTAELEVKSPLFKFTNGLIYFVSYFCLRLKTSSYYFTLAIVILTILYMAIALILTYRVAPKTFRLK